MGIGRPRADERLRHHRCDVLRFLAGDERLLTDADELRALLRGERRIEAGEGRAEDERRDAVRIARVEVLQNPPAHREPDKMGALDLEMVQQPSEVVGEIREVERAFVIVGEAVAARIPRDGAKAVGGECRELIAPVRPMAPDAVKKDDDRPFAGGIEGDAGSTGDALGGEHGHGGGSSVLGSVKSCAK